ncbi:uncharacterized protein LOC144007647 [Festucalex cinctus]
MTELLTLSLRESPDTLRTFTSSLQLTPSFQPSASFVKKISKYTRLGSEGTRKRDHLAKAETLSADGLLQAAEMKQDCSILLHIQDKDCHKGCAVLFQRLHKVLKVNSNRNSNQGRTNTTLC